MNRLVLCRVTACAALLLAGGTPHAARAQVAAAPPAAPGVASPVDSARLPLFDAVQRALAQYPATAAARAEHDRATAVAAEAKAARWPRLSIDGATTQFQEPMIVAPLHGFDVRTPPQFERTLVQGHATASWPCSTAAHAVRALIARPIWWMWRPPRRR